MDRLEHRARYGPVRIPPAKWEADTASLSVSLREAEAAEANAVLALVCRAVLFHTAHAREVITVEDPEAFVASSVQIFTALQCPSSRVFENYHSKSQIAGQPAAPVRRRVLVPLNPAVDPFSVAIHAFPAPGL
jgi:hypothetical protein